MTALMPSRAVAEATDTTRPIAESMRTSLSDPCTDADARIQDEIAQHWREASTLGDADEYALRRRILFALLRPEVQLVESVLAAHPFRRSDLLGDVDDLRIHLAQQLERLILGPVYDLTVARTASTVGWARKMLALRARRWFATHGSTLRGEIMDTGYVTRPDRASDEQIAQIEDLQERMHNTRGVTRERIGAVGVRSQLDLPEFTVPDTRPCRDALYRGIREDPTVLHDALDEYLNAFTRPTATLSPAAQLFSGWDYEDADRVRRVHLDLLALVARGDLAPLPRPSNSRITRVRWFVRGLSDEAHWVSLAVRLVNSWIDEHCSAVNDWDGRKDFNEAEQERAVRAAAWREYAPQALAWPGNPLGAASVRDVARKMQRYFEDGGE